MMPRGPFDRCREKRESCVAFRVMHEALRRPPTSISAYLLPPGVFRSQPHIMCRNALLPVNDTLPHFSGVPARFGGSDEQVAW